MGGPENHRKCIYVTPKLGLSWRFGCVTDTLPSHKTGRMKYWKPMNQQQAIGDLQVCYCVHTVVNIRDGS